MDIIIRQYGYELSRVVWAVEMVIDRRAFTRTNWEAM